LTRLSGGTGRRARERHVRRETKARMAAMVVVTSDENSHAKSLAYTTTKKRPKHMVLFIATAPYTYTSAVPGVHAHA